MQSQIFRDNYPSDDPEHFFQEAIFVPYLDHLIVEMEAWASEGVFPGGGQ